MGFLANVMWCGAIAFIPLFGQIFARMYYRNMWEYMIFWIPIFWMPPFSFIPALYALFGQFRKRKKPMSTTTKLLIGFFLLIVVAIVGFIGWWIYKEFFGTPEGGEMVAGFLRGAANYADPNKIQDLGKSVNNLLESTSPFI